MWKVYLLHKNIISRLWTDCFKFLNHCLVKIALGKEILTRWRLLMYLATLKQTMFKMKRKYNRKHFQTCKRMLHILQYTDYIVTTIIFLFQTASVWSWKLYIPTNTWFLSKLRKFETTKCYRHNIEEKYNLCTVWEPNSFNT